MDLVGAIVNMQASSAVGAVQIRAAKKLLENDQMQGAAALKLIESAANGTNEAGNAVAAQALGLGGMLDVKG